MNGFLRVFPLTLVFDVDRERFGFGEPARADLTRVGPGQAEYVLAISAIRRFEECPLYFVDAESDNTLLDGVRVELDSGGVIVLADDALEPEARFVALIDRLSRLGGVATLRPSSLLKRCRPVRTLDAPAQTERKGD
ncbi:MAG: hypothetical protein ACK4IT_02245 [Thioalkalivibrionaceae bacterium]